MVELPPRCTVGDQEIYLDKSMIRANLEVESDSTQGSLEPAQRDIMTGALNILHEMCATRQIPVVHTFIAKTPEWYVTEVSALAKASAEAKGCAAMMITGAVPTERGADDSIRKRSSAGHFNASFSRYWAQRWRTSS